MEISFLPEFVHLQNVLVDYCETGTWSVDEDNEVGSRKSTKTWTIEKFIIVAAHGRPTAAYVFRKMTKDLHETIESFKDRCDMLGITYNYEATRHIIHFSSGSYVKFKGLKTQQDKKAKLTGLSAAPSTHGIIKWYEEAFEFTDQDVSLAEQAIRGGNGNSIMIRSCNPWLYTNWYIKYCHKHLAFDKAIMGSVGNQFKRLQEKVIDVRSGETHMKRLIFNYTNWKINKYLRIDDVFALEQTKLMSPQLADASYYGVPGSMGGLIFNDVMKSIRPINFTPTEFVGGIDYGVAESSTTFSLWGRDGSLQQLGKFGEWYHNNLEDGFMEPTDMGRNIVNYIIELAQQFPIMKRGFTVYVDYAATGFISILKEKTYNEGCELWLDFRPSYKPDVMFAINWFYTAISMGVLHMDERVSPKTLEEYNTMAWDVKDNTDDVKPIKKWDHTFDADKYAIFGAGWNDNIDAMTQNELLRGMY